MAESKKYYWLKLKKDFFKRHEIKIVEGMPNGKDYILFYLKLLVESLNHEGKLRFSNTIPYDENMLSIITNTNVDIVRSAMKLFKELEMVEILDDKTIYMTELQEMIGSETEWAEKKRIYREKRKELPLNSNDEKDTQKGQKRTLSDKSIEIRDKSIDNINIYTQKSNELFNVFWSEYPKKRSKGDAEKAFTKLKPDKNLVMEMVKKIRLLKKTTDWQKQDGQFIPYPATWLRNKGWEDEIKEEVNETEKHDEYDVTR